MSSKIDKNKGALENINYLHSTCDVCGKTYNGNDPSSHIPFKDCPKEAVEKALEEVRKAAQRIQGEYNGN